MSYNEAVIGHITPLKLLGLVLSISGIISGAYLLMEWLFTYRLFTVFRKFAPEMLRALFPHDPTILWFSIRSDRGLYNAWDVALVYLLLLPILFLLAAGCWVFLVLRLASISDIGTSWLSAWFVINWLVYSWSSVNQYAVELKVKDKEATPESIKKHMVEDPWGTLRRWTFYSLRNWLTTPAVSAVLLVIVVLFVLLHWPAWIIKALHVTHLDLESNRSRTYYYVTYALLAGIPGLILTTIVT
jgi:hypothetical protein